MQDNKGTIEGFEDLDVFKLAHKLALEIYRFTSSFPQEEL